MAATVMINIMRARLIWGARDFPVLAADEAGVANGDSSSLCFTPVLYSRSHSETAVEQGQTPDTSNGPPSSPPKGL